MVNSNQHGGQNSGHGTHGKHRPNKKIPGAPAGAVGCRIQDPGTHGYWWWKTADFSHSAWCTPKHWPSCTPAMLIVNLNHVNFAHDFMAMQIRILIGALALKRAARLAISEYQGHKDRVCVMLQ